MLIYYVNRSIYINLCTDERVQIVSMFRGLIGFGDRKIDWYRGIQMIREIDRKISF